MIVIIIDNKEGGVGGGGEAPHLRGQLECWSPIVKPLPYVYCKSVFEL